MAEIRRFPVMRHLKTEPSFYVLHYRGGKLIRSGRGLTFWFFPIGTSVAEIPMDDRDHQVYFTGRAKDHQEITVQAVVTYRVTDPDRLAGRIDFTLDLVRGLYLKQPLEQLAGLLTGLAQQLAMRYLALHTIQELLEKGLEPIQASIVEGFRQQTTLPVLGVEVVAVRVIDLAPTPEMEKALRTPTREAIQQKADEATFQRRALAVEKERAIAENELQNEIELARKEEALITQRGLNEQNRAREEAEARRIEIEAAAQRSLVEGEAKARRIQVVAKAKTDAEKDRMDIYRELPAPVLIGLAAQEFAGKLQSIEHLNVTPDMLAPLFADLLETGAKRLGGA